MLHCWGERRLEDLRQVRGRVRCRGRVGDGVGVGVRLGLDSGWG